MNKSAQLVVRMEPSMDHSLLSINIKMSMETSLILLHYL